MNNRSENLEHHLDRHLVEELAQVARETVRDELREQSRRQRRTALLYAASGAVALYAGGAVVALASRVASSPARIRRGLLIPIRGCTTSRP
ncbi:hypothetical protein ACWCQV_24325, partial [Streptomyces eurythermus]